MLDHATPTDDSDSTPTTSRNARRAERWRCPAPAQDTSEQEAEEQALLAAGGRRVADGDTRQGRAHGRADHTDEDGIEGPNSA